MGIVELLFGKSNELKQAHAKIKDLEIAINEACKVSDSLLTYIHALKRGVRAEEHYLHVYTAALCHLRGWKAPSVQPMVNMLKSNGFWLSKSPLHTIMTNGNVEVYIHGDPWKVGQSTSEQKADYSVISVANGESVRVVGSSSDDDYSVLRVEEILKRLER